MLNRDNVKISFEFRLGLNEEIKPKRFFTIEHSFE